MNPELPPDATRAIRAGLPCTDTFPSVDLHPDDVTPSLLPDPNRRPTMNHTLEDEVLQARAVFAPVAEIPDQELLEIARSLQARAHGIDHRTASPDETLAALTLEAQSDDPLVKIGQLLGRVIAFRHMFPEDTPETP